MHAEEHTAEMARNTRSWFVNMRDRLLGRTTEAAPERAAVRPRVAASAGMLGALGKIFGFGAASRVASAMPGLNAAERRALRASMERSAGSGDATRSAEATLENRVAGNIAKAERLNRSIDASSMSEDEKRALRERLAAARTNYEAAIATGQERDAAVAAVVAQSAATESPVLVARGRYFMSGTSFDAFTEAFGTAMRDRRNAGLIARTFAAFRAGFTSVRETLTGGRPCLPAGRRQAGITQPDIGLLTLRPTAR